MNKLTFTSSLDEQGRPYHYSVDGEVSTDGESAPVGFSTFDFNRAFDELCHWAKACPDLVVEFSTIVQ